jgi:L-gulonolactone oxidase
VRVNVIAELRFVQGDDGWLSPAYGGDVVQLGAYTAFPRDRDTYFEAFWSEMGRLGGRPHWGKAMEHTAADLAPLYPQWERFGALRDELDPHRVFANRFLDRVLE